MMSVRSSKARIICNSLFSCAGLALAAGIIFPSQAMAQTTPPTASTPPATTAAEPQATAEDTADITVTGSRIVRDGFQAPTPTTVLGAAEIAAKAPTNLADFVNELPSLAGSSTPRTSVPAVSAGNAGINALNLRNLGVTRTLVLVDGQRIGAASLAGFVDVNQIPQALVSRVDVVTGGASASYGSDAVAGVINFVLDKRFTGLKGEVQSGVSDYGDDANYRATLTGGTSFAGGRGHLIVSGEIAHNDGIRGIGNRNWYNGTKTFLNPAYVAGNGLPQYLIRANTGFATAAPGGIITSGPLRGTYFGAGGTPLAFNYGPIVSGNFMVGGQWQDTDFATSADLDPELSRQNVFGRVSFEVSNNFEVFAQLTYARATTSAAFGYQQKFGNVTIQPDNAFLPGSLVRPATSFSLGTLSQDIGVLTVDTTRHTWRPVVGLQGGFNALGSSWKWDAYAQWSISDAYVRATPINNDNYNLAVDAVRNPVTGAIVCRSTLTNPTNGCVPFNVFGTGVNSQAAINYVTGNPYLRTKLKQDVYAANLRGTPFSTWAGPVSIAMGIEHRRESVSGSNTPLVTATVRPFYAGNYLASSGKYDVTEGYFETLVPLAADLPFAKRLDLNAAVRETHYSSSGDVTTWKVGVTYQPVSDITIRATRSRDIRAGTLGELFQAPSSAASTVIDPFRNNASTSYFQVTAGNPNVKPEIADTTTVGLVLQPRFIPGLSASVDFYDIRIKDAITTLQGVTVLGQCFGGNTALCPQIARAATGTVINGLTPITTISVVPINIAKQRARGLDFELGYRHSFEGSGTLSLRGVATHYLKNETNNQINLAVDTVGTNYGAGSASTSLPKWSYRASIGWDQDPVALLFTARGFSDGVYNNNYVVCTTGCPLSTTDRPTIESNSIPGAIYFDANVTFDVGKKAQFFLSVDNIANRDPAQVSYGPSIGGAPLSVNPALYDVIGRSFRAGFRFKL